MKNRQHGNYHRSHRFEGGRGFREGYEPSHSVDYATAIAGVP